MQVIHKPKPKPELMTQTELLAYVHELEDENARLEEGYQKSVGVIAATDCAECKKDAEPVKHARWVKTGRTNGYGETEYKCSNCQASIYVPDGSLIAREKYCFNCGCKMTLKDGEEQ